MLARFPQGRSLSACVPAGRALWFFLLLLLFCTLAKTRSDPMMKCLISNEFWITDVLNCRMNALHIYLKDRRNRNRFIHIPCFFSTGERFEMKSGPVGGGHAVFDYDDSQKNVMTNWTCLCLRMSQRRSGREDRVGWRKGKLFFSLSFFFFFLTGLLDCDSEGEENEGVNRSDYQGGLMVLTVPIWQANSTLDR